VTDQQRKAENILSKLYGPVWTLDYTTLAERDGKEGLLCRISTGRISQLVQLERLRKNGLSCEIVEPGKVFVWVAP
jgi:hypothetical protein